MTTTDTATDPGADPSNLEAVSTTELPPEDFRGPNAQMRYQFLDCNLRMQEARAAGDTRLEAAIRRERDRIADEFINKNTRLAQSAVSPFMVKEGADADHLQAALLGLWEAFVGTDPEAIDAVIVGTDGRLHPVCGWDPAKGTFATWAGNFIAGKVKRSVRGSEGAFAGMSYHTFTQKPKVDAARRELTEELGCTPSIAQIATRAGVTADTVRACSNGTPASLDTTVGDGDTTLGDLVADTATTLGGYDVSADDAEAALVAAAAGIATIDLLVLLLREGFISTPPRSVVQTADKLGIGRGHASLALSRAQKQLAAAVRAAR